VRRFSVLQFGIHRKLDFRRAVRISFFEACGRETSLHGAQDHRENDAAAMICGEMWKSKAVSEKCSTDAGSDAVERKHQQTPQDASHCREQYRFRKKLTRILPREKPSTRRVPISRARRATAAYMVFMAAKLLPMAMITQTKIPMNSIGAPTGLYLEVLGFRERVHVKPLVVFDTVNQRPRGDGVVARTVAALSTSTR